MQTNQLTSLALLSIDSQEDRKDFIISKVTCLASMEEGEEGKNEFAVNYFREHFQELNEEKFITCMHTFLLHLLRLLEAFF